VIVSVWTDVLLLGNLSNIKQRMKNAVEYAISEGGRIFLSESGTDFSTLIHDVVKEYPDAIHMPIDKKEIEEKSIYGMLYKRYPSVKAYLYDKADLTIVFESADDVVVGDFSKAAVRVKI